MLNKAFYDESSYTVYITDNLQDQATLMACDVNAIAIDQYGYTSSHFVEQMSLKPTRKVVIFCPIRSDYPRWNEIRKQLQALTKIETEFLPTELYFKKQSVTDAMSADVSRFMGKMKRYRSRAEEQADPKPGNISHYFHSGRYKEDIEKFRQGAEVRTDFPILDRKIGGGLYAGLYVIGAVPTLGKTTFCLQLADQIAEQARPVLFFSMEQSRLELVSKSISRTARENSPGDQTKILTSLQIRRGETSPTMKDAFEIYSKKIAPYMNIIEGNFETNIGTIRQMIQRYIERNKARPVILIDYLQILQPEGKTKATDPRVLTDQNITALKRISRDYEIPVIVISSFNRTNYKQTVDYESFKETSGIEYTADVLLGMEYSIIAQLDGKNANDDREAVSEAKRAPEREIKLKCLKNRYGQANFEISFKYYPKFDYFREDADIYSDRQKNIPRI